MTEESPTAAGVMAALAERADASDAEFLQGFFKTGAGQYGEGDVFIGVRVPQIRAVAKRFIGLSESQASVLLDSEVHEHRLTALVIAVLQFERAGRSAARDDVLRRRLHVAYLDAARRGRVNNWDLVDTSAEYLVGEYLYDTGAGDAGSELLRRLAASPSLWERRVAVLATFGFIKHGEAGPTLDLAPRLLDDPEDLMHKAVGWMLREVGKRVDRAELVGFLDEYASRMPRTMLSYATEHLSPPERAAYRALPRK